VNDIYKEGFKAGLRSQREEILDFIRIHDEQNVEITVEDIAIEINGQYKREMEETLREMREFSAKRARKL
jgi:acetolactate synthase small subunit